MNAVRSFSRSCLVRLFVINLVLFGLVWATAWFGCRFFFTPVTFSDVLDIAHQNPQWEAWAQRAALLQAWGKTLFLPAGAFLLVCFTLLQWLVVRSGFNRLIRKTGMDTAGPERKKEKDRRPPAGEKEAAMPEKELQQQYQRYYLHLISVLQRQGRLVDFFKEDLNAYADAQIGAAVRSIHENCARAVDKYIAPAPVIDKPEGEPITVPPGFDTAAIKLTGNVTGEPPFTGRLRHRGWRAGKLELPVLSGSGDPRVIAPAEVEVD